MTSRYCISDRKCLRVSDITLYLTLAVSVASLLAWLYTAAFKLGALSTKVDTLWEIYVKDALSEARRSHGNPKPIEIQKLFPPTARIQIEKLTLCTTAKPKTDTQLLLKLQKDFGNELTKISEENKLPYRAVLGTALLIAKEFNNKKP